MILPNGGFLAAIPGVYVYAVVSYIRRLNALERHPVYTYLVGVQRRSFTFATTRYNFFSPESLQVYATIVLASWKACLAYISLLAALMLFKWAFDSEELGGWFSRCSARTSRRESTARGAGRIDCQNCIVSLPGTTILEAALRCSRPNRGCRYFVHRKPNPGFERWAPARGAASRAVGWGDHPQKSSS